MPTPHDVPAQAYITKLAKYLKENVDQVTPLPWAIYAKTGSYATRQPQDPDWWYTRCASLLRKTYIKGPIGVEKLRGEYSRRKDCGTRPEHVRKGAGSVNRKLFQQLETAGLVANTKGEGRALTSEGRRLLDKVATEAKAELEKRVPELAKY